MISSSETNVPVSEWSTGTLKIYHDDKLAAIQAVAAAETKRIDADIKQLNVLLDERSITQEKAVAAALTATREAIGKSETATEKRFENADDKQQAIIDQTNGLLGRTEYISAHQALIEKIDSVTTRVAAIENRSEGGDLQMGKIYAALVAVGTILGIIVILANKL